jgi:hypothetical protein
MWRLAVLHAGSPIELIHWHTPSPFPIAYFPGRYSPYHNFCYPTKLGLRSTGRYEMSRKLVIFSCACVPLFYSEILYSSHQYSRNILFVYFLWAGRAKSGTFFDNVGAETRGDDDIEKNMQKIIPDGWIGRFLLDAPFDSPPNRLYDCETFVEFKTLASLAITPNARAQQVQADTEKCSHDLDLKYPGSTSVLLPIFLTISWSCVTLLDELVPLKRLTAGTSTRSMRWQSTSMFWYLILVT